MVFALLRLESLRILDATWRTEAVARVRGWWSKRRPREPEQSNVPVNGPPVTSETVPSAAQKPSSFTSSPAQPTLLANEAEREVELRREEVRARFDALFDRLLALEDTLDALGKRFALRGVHERRAEQRVLDRIEALGETLERRNVELEAILSVLARLEQRLEHVERRSRLDDGGERGERESLRTDPSELSERVERRPTDARRLSRNAPDDTPELWDVAPFSTSSMRGNLAEVSLPTVLGMLELERRTGVLKVCADDGSVMSATLREGLLVGARLRDLDSEPIEAIREALHFKRGHFWFRQLGVEVAMGPPKSVGSVLLEATRQNDEALRSA